jgi:hypothetical protein
LNTADKRASFSFAVKIHIRFIKRHSMSFWSFGDDESVDIRRSFGIHLTIVILKIEKLALCSFHIHISEA